MDINETITKILKESHTIAVVGLSNNPERPSYRVANYLKSQGYRIIPVNPSITEALGEKSYPDLAAIPDPVDVVDIFRKPEDVPPIVEATIAKGAKVVWLQEGVVNEAAAERARSAGLLVVMDHCMFKEHSRLRREGRL
jgi:predicted CoA-binding protein